MPSDTAYQGPLGDHFVRHSDRHPTNAYIDRPAMLALIGDVAGLDAPASSPNAAAVSCPMVAKFGISPNHCALANGYANTATAHAARSVLGCNGVTAAAIAS